VGIDSHRTTVDTGPLRRRDLVPPDGGHRLFIDNDWDLLGFAEF
jgi:hypothetical protein